MATARTPIGVTFSVWKALFLREAVHRLFGSRAAWVWLLLEPVAHIAFLVVIMSGVRMQSVGGVDAAIWIMVGMVAFFMFKRAASQGMNAVGSNQALFAYRQVKPVDTVLVRAGLEAFLMLLITFIIFVGAWMLGLEVVPVNPLAALEGLFGLWLIGLGYGLIASVASGLVPELGKIIDLMMTPLYFFSGAMLPIIHIPMPYREWLMYNPLPHGLEAVRLGFFPYYQVVPETSIAYLYIFALIMVFFGLALHVRFALRLATQ